MQFKHVLITLNYGEERMAKIREALAPAKITMTTPKDTAGISEALKTADAAILNSDLNDQILREGKNLRWIHCGHAGLTKSARPEVFERGILLTGSAGRSAPSLAEHALYFMMTLSYRWAGYVQKQHEHRWEVPDVGAVSLYGKTVAILGIGYTGKALAQRCKAMGMTVLGYRRKDEDDPNVDEMFCESKGDTVDMLLPRADFVVLCMNLSDKTYRLLDEKRLALLKPTAYLVNLARGGLIDENALIECLKAGKIAGAALDTVTNEPLSADSPLWDLPNVLITPHSSPAFAPKEDNSTAVILYNIQALKEDRPLKNQFTWEDVYTH